MGKTYDKILEIYKRIEKDDHNCFVTLCKDEALKQAEKIDNDIRDGKEVSSVFGLPFSVKDNICTKGIKTTCCSKMLKDFVPSYNATAVDRLLKNGAILIGKTNMDEFGMGSSTENSYFGVTKNPYDKSKVAGGSSGGSAAEIALGFTSFSLGSDTGGSVRQPASLCGVTGFKPTYGNISRYGLISYSSSFDQIGIITKKVKDLYDIYNIIGGYDNKDSTSSKNFKKVKTNDIKILKIGLPINLFEDKNLDDEVKNKVLDVAKTYKDLGFFVEEFYMENTEYIIPVYYIIASAEASSNLARFDGVRYGYCVKDAVSLDDLYKRNRSEGFGYEVKKRIMLGTFVLSDEHYESYYKKALRLKNIIKKSFNNTFLKYDLILSPVFPTTALNIGESKNNPLKTYLSDIYTVTSNLLGLPSISLNCGFDSKGMPIGFELIGKAFDENTVLDAARIYQEYFEKGDKNGI